MELAASRYSGTNHTHLSELLMEREGIFLSRSTVRRIALSAGIESPRRRRPPKHRVRRQRMPQEGMLVQVDGSHHRWLEDRGPRFALLLAVDDATGTVPYALFRPGRGRDGIPAVDRGDDRAPRGTPCALQRSSRCLQKPCTASAEAARTDAVRPGHAAVGHKTDLRPVATGQGACRACGRDIPGQTGHRAATGEGRDHGNMPTRFLHRYLPRFDEQFGVPAAQSEVAYRKPPSAAAVEQALCFGFHRKVARDNTVRHRWRTLQLLPGMERTSYAGAQVEVLERPDGRLLVEYQGHLIEAQEAPPRPEFLRVLGNRTTPDGRVNGSSHGHQELACLEKTDVDSEQAASPREKTQAVQLQDRGSQPRARRLCGRRFRRPGARGLSLRAIARELGIHRETARRYALTREPAHVHHGSSPPQPYPIPSTTTAMDNFAEQLTGHFP